MADFERLSEAVKELSAFSLPSYGSLPEIELYMDQLCGYLNRYLSKTCQSEDSAPLTQSRVNNYVKDGRIKPPVKKKYDRERIAMLYMLCSLKQNLPLPKASALLSMLGGEDTESLYGEFCALQEPIVKGCAAELEALGDSKEALLKKALELTVRAAAEQFVAEEIISSLSEDGAGEGESEKPRKKKKKKAEIAAE